MPHAQVNGISLYCEEHGAGTPLLLIMGFTANATAWEPMLPALSARHRVIAFDNRGAGRSDAPDEPYSMTQFADDAWGVLDALEIDKAHIYGVSMGGMIAQHVYFRQPERVLSLTLGCTTPGGADAVRADEQTVSTLMASATMAPREAFEANLSILYSDAFVAANRDALLARMEQNAHLRAGVVGVRGQMAAIQDHDLAGRLGEITAPTLVLHGDADPLVPTANGQLLAERIPGARLVLYPGARHSYSTEYAAQSVADLLDFLASVAAPALAD